MDVKLVVIIQISGLIIITLSAILIIILWPWTRRKFRENRSKMKNAELYETHLHKLVLGRQILLFLLPTAVLMVSTRLEHLFSSIVLGLSILIFVSIQLPLLMKAHIHITFNIDGKWTRRISLRPEQTHKVEVAIQNLGFSTYKNFVAKFYYGKEFKILPNNYRGYKDLDFGKEFSVQKRHGGVMFTPKENFLTIPPQEVYIFPMYVKAPKEEREYKLKIEFNAENTWGMNEIFMPIIVKG
jgi:hypothetical protein